MNIITAICLILCTFIICTTIFFTIVYLSELKREKQLRHLLLEEAQKNYDLIKEMPVMLVDVPVQQIKKSIEPSVANKDKKDIN